MAILIRDMDMPTGCNSCPFEHFGDCYGGKFKRFMDIETFMDSEIRHPNCPLEDVSTYSFRIDRDTLEKLIDAEFIIGGR